MIYELKKKVVVIYQMKGRIEGDLWMEDYMIGGFFDEDTTHLVMYATVVKPYLL